MPEPTRTARKPQQNIYVTYGRIGANLKFEQAFDGVKVRTRRWRGVAATKISTGQARMGNEGGTGARGRGTGDVEPTPERDIWLAKIRVLHRELTLFLFPPAPLHFFSDPHTYFLCRLLPSCCKCQRLGDCGHGSYRRTSSLLTTRCSGTKRHLERVMLADGSVCGAGQCAGNRLRLRSSPGEQTAVGRSRILSLASLALVIYVHVLGVG
ncbi:hypothetical protein BKA62DRAFT_672449 [Auriculariales sp. MPI-PUGE-AT-0066]|nr:hypothetical protein BKA62DRAFT_672449 [Auriculariales sp. MPI-PUGE-AT-0066]